MARKKCKPAAVTVATAAALLDGEQLANCWIDRLKEWREDAPPCPDSVFGVVYQDLIFADRFRRLATGRTRADVHPDDEMSAAETEALLIRAGADRWAGVELLVLVAPELESFQLLDPGARVNGLVDFILRQRLGDRWPTAFDARVAVLASHGWTSKQAQQIARAEYSFQPVEGVTEPPRLQHFATRAERWEDVTREYPTLHDEALPAMGPWIDEGRGEELALLLSNVPTQAQLDALAPAREGLDREDLEEVAAFVKKRDSVWENWHAIGAEDHFHFALRSSPVYEAARLCAAHPDQITEEFAGLLYQSVRSDLPQLPPLPPLFDRRATARMSQPLPPAPVLLHWARNEAAPFIASITRESTEEPTKSQVTIQ